MNILQVISRLDESDGSEDVIASTRYLTLNGHKVVVVSERGERVKEIDEVGARHFVMPLKKNVLFTPLALFKLSRIISRENIQVVHARDAVSSFAAFFASRAKEKAFITTIYDYFKTGFLGRSRFWAKRVICFSENDAANIVRKGFASRGKVRIIPPFVYASKASGREKKDRFKGHFVVGAVLPVFSKELAQNFIKAVSTVSRTVYKLKVFIINGAALKEKDSTEKLRLLVKRLSLKNIVTFLSGDEKEIMPELDLFVQVNEDSNLSSRHFLQAKASGIPVVTTYIDKIEDYAEDRKTALVCNGNNPQEMAERILDLYKDEKLRKRIRGAADAFVREKFNIQKIMESTLELYEEVTSTKNILVIKIGALGDVILAVPSLRAIREKFRNARIKLLVGIGQRDVFVNSPFVDEVMVCDFKGRDRGLSGLLRIAKNLREENPDIVVDLQNNKKSHLLSFLSCAPKRYGYDNGKLGFLLNRKVRDKGVPLDPVEHQARVLGLLGIYNIKKNLELWPSREDEEWADNFLKSHWVKENMKLVAVNIGSSPRWVTKLWPVDHFVELCNKLARNFGIRVILVGRESRDARTEEFLKRTKCKPMVALGKTNLTRLASLIKRCDVLLSSDSAPIHVAASVGTPFIALFGPTDPARHMPPVKNGTVIKKNFPCMPCYETRCDKGYMCMQSIKPEAVHRELMRLLESETKNQK